MPWACSSSVKRKRALPVRVDSRTKARIQRRKPWAAAAAKRSDGLRGPRGACQSVPWKLMAAMIAGTRSMIAATTPEDWIQAGTGEPRRWAAPAQAWRVTNSQKATVAR